MFPFSSFTRLVTCHFVYSLDGGRSRFIWVVALPFLLHLLGISIYLNPSLFLFFKNPVSRPPYYSSCNVQRLATYLYLLLCFISSPFTYLPPSPLHTPALSFYLFYRRLFSRNALSSRSAVVYLLIAPVSVHVMITCHDLHDVSPLILFHFHSVSCCILPSNSSKQSIPPSNFFQNLPPTVHKSKRIRLRRPALSPSRVSLTARTTRPADTPYTSTTHSPCHYAEGCASQTHSAVFSPLRLYHQL